MTPQANNAGATVTMTVNGQTVTGGLVPLNVGANTVVITVTDATGTKKYVVTVYRDSGIPSSGGGNTWTPPTTPTETGSTTTKIKVELEIDGENNSGN